MWVIREMGDKTGFCLFWSRKGGLMEKTNNNSLQWNLSPREVFGEEDGVGEVVLRKMMLFTNLLDAYDTATGYMKSRLEEWEGLDGSLRFSTPQLTDPWQIAACAPSLGFLSREMVMWGQHPYDSQAGGCRRNAFWAVSPQCLSRIPMSARKKSIKIWTWC